MRQYPTNSPEALARIIVVAMMADGAINESELRSLERHEIIRRIGLDHAGFHKVFYECYADLSIGEHRLPSGQFELDTLTISQLLNEIRQPELQRMALQSMLDVVNADHCLTSPEASLIAQAFRQWKPALLEVSEPAIPVHRLPLAKVAEIHLT